MAKKSYKQDKAVKKIEKVVRKAVDKGVSTEVVSGTVEDALGTIADVDTGDSEESVPVAAKARKLPGLRKYPNLPLKRGYTNNAKVDSADVNTEPMKPDSEKPSLKKLPGKRKPPTLTLKRGDIAAAAVPAAKKATKLTGLNKQTDVTMKRG
jgi:hypothetical protein